MEENKDKIKTEEKAKLETDKKKELSEKKAEGNKELDNNSKEEKKDETSPKKESSEKKESEDKSPEKKEEKIKDKPEVKKKSEASVNVNNIPISTKHSKAVCKFIKGKRIGDAIRDLEKVIVAKKAVPMKGEIPHRKGKGMMSGRFPKNASERFVKLLKSLASNSTYNGIDEPVVAEAVANIGSRPYGRFGRVRTKRTHVKIVAKEAVKKIK